MTVIVPQSMNKEQNTLDLTAFSQVLKRLQDESESLRHQYNMAQPYPHVVIDNLFETALLNRVIAEFPQAKESGWFGTHNTNLKQLLRALIDCPCLPNCFAFG